MIKHCLLWILLGIGTSAFGQQSLRDFTLTNVADGKPVTLSEYSVPVVIIFTSNECAFDKYYAERIRTLTEAYSGKVQFLLINSNVEPAETADAMTKVYSARKYQAPYLADKDQAVMAMLQAKKNPEVFLLLNAGGKFSVAYHGPIDDNPQVASDVKKNYLRDNINKVLASQGVEEREVRVQGGCSIRKK